MPAGKSGVRYAVMMCMHALRARPLVALVVTLIPALFPARAVCAGEQAILSGSAGGSALPRTAARISRARSAAEAYAEGDYELALEHLDRLTAKPGARDLLLKGATLMRLGRSSEAREAFVLAQAQDPVDPSIPLCLAEAAIVEGDTELARGYLRRPLNAPSAAIREFAQFLEVLSYLRDSDADTARRRLEAMPWPAATAARLFAEAALELANGRPGEATDRMAEAQRVFGKQAALTFSDSLVSLGMLKRGQ